MDVQPGRVALAAPVEQAGDAQAAIGRQAGPEVLQEGGIGVQVMGAGIDSYNGYGQRGAFHIIERQMAAAVELFPIFASIRSGTPINNGDYMSKSTLMGIMGRMACYTGQEVTWDQALNSVEDLSPPRYEWGNIAVPPVARPGVTRLS